MFLIAKFRSKSPFEQSRINRIGRVLKKMDHRQGIPRYEVLLISKDPSTIRIIKSYFDDKMFKINDVSSCSQALEE